MLPPPSTEQAEGTRDHLCVPGDPRLLPKGRGQPNCLACLTRAAVDGVALPVPAAPPCIESMSSGHETPGSPY